MAKTTAKIKSTKLTLKYLNAAKHLALCIFIDEYRRVVRQYIEFFWDIEKIPKNIPKPLYSLVTDSWLTSRALQCAAGQAGDIVRGTRTKQSQRTYRYDKLLQEGKLKRARRLKAIIDGAKVSRPDVKNVEPRLTQNFFRIDWDNPTSWDGIITLTSLGNKIKIIIPVKRHRHFNKLASDADKMCNVVALSKSNVTMSFEMATPPPVAGGSTIGLDIGIINAFTTSDSQQSTPDIHGHTLRSINTKLARKQKGSRAFQAATAHRTNYSHWTLNQLNLKGVSTLRVENIKNMRRGKPTSRFLSHFTYPEMYAKLQDLCNSYGCSMERVNPTYTSQRCNHCGWVRKSNRKGERFKCGACKFECNSDYNAALNIALGLPSISKAERLRYKNRKGFYWNAARGTPIVSPAPNCKI